MLQSWERQCLQSLQIFFQEWLKNYLEHMIFIDAVHVHNFWTGYKDFSRGSVHLYSTLVHEQKAIHAS